MNLPVYSKKVEVACGGGVWATVYRDDERVDYKRFGRRPFSGVAGWGPAATKAHKWCDDLIAVCEGNDCNLTWNHSHWMQAAVDRALVCGRPSLNLPAVDFYLTKPVNVVGGLSIEGEARIYSPQDDAAFNVKAGVQFRLTPQIIPRGHRGVCLRVIGWDNVSVCGEPV